MYYYMISVYTDKKTKQKNYRPFINPYNSIKKAKKAVQWQQMGGFDNEQIICKRLDSVKFQNINTKEVLTINKDDRTPYTVEAWNNFINRKY